MVCYKLEVFKIQNMKQPAEEFVLSLGPQNGWNDPPALTRAPKKKVSLH